jgi:hypothetical protein
MDLPEDEHAFLRDLVKAARQKTIHVKWVDRDGSDRQTSLSQPEAVRLNGIAQRLGTSKQEVLRRAAHIPVAKPVGKKPARSGTDDGAPDA